MNSLCFLSFPVIFVYVHRQCRIYTDKFLQCQYMVRQYNQLYEISRTKILLSHTYFMYFLVSSDL